jgi:hypothetical protein
LPQRKWQGADEISAAGPPRRRWFFPSAGMPAVSPEKWAILHSPLQRAKKPLSLAACPQRNAVDWFVLNRSASVAAVVPVTFGQQPRRASSSRCTVSIAQCAADNWPGWGETSQQADPGRGSR